VHEGIRGARFSLAECVDYHASRPGGGEAMRPINAQGEFCQTCHEFAAVSIDCFQCHRTVPRQEQSSAGLLPGPSLGSLRFDDLRSEAVAQGRSAQAPAAFAEGGH